MTVEAHSPGPLVLAGPPGVGKTTVAAALADRLDRPAADLDALVLAATARTPAELIREEGEARFREVEAELLEGFEAGPGVLALGGGALTTARGRAAARRIGPLFGLEASPEVLSARLEGTGEPDRPLLADGLEALLARRHTTYLAVDARVAATAPVGQIAERIMEGAADLRLLEARVGEARTRVLVGRKLHDAPAGAIANLSPRRPVLAIVDVGVPAEAREARLAPIRELFEVVTVEVPGGEAVKTWSFAGDVLERALSAGCGRQSVVFGLGGGATCDLAGFVAHLLGRGASLVLAPSTLLAQVDASVGGKCAVNMVGGRNLVGAFHPATDVVADVALLESLDPAERRSGLAELLKIALIGDEDLFDSVSAGGPVGPAEIGRAVELKASIVERDPFEAGVRRTLNLGHTLGHALESASGHALRHGEAVAIGIAAVARLSAELGFASQQTADRVVAGLARVGLPTSIDPELCRRAAEHIGADKKNAAGEAALICIHEVASVSVQTLPLAEAQARLVRHGGHR